MNKRMVGMESESYRREVVNAKGGLVRPCIHRREFGFSSKRNGVTKRVSARRIVMCLLLNPSVA